MKNFKEKEDREKIAQKFFSQNKRSLYDIMPRGKHGNSPSKFDVKSDDVEEKPRMMDLDEDTIDDNKDEDVDDDDSGTFEPTINSKFKNRPRRRTNKFKIISSATLVVAILLGYYLLFVLPKATIEITLKQKTWEYHDTLTASMGDKTLPLQVFALTLSGTKNIIKSFPSTGSKNVTRKAHGSIKVCNAFNSDAQSLVATTRFQNSSNVIFRLDKGIVVPGATIADGKIQAKCIDASVIADKAGTESNVGPTDKWSIPGFKGTAKYDAFYGASDKAMTGGLVGNTKVPTASDISKAKLAAREELQKIIVEIYAAALPPGIKIVQDSKSTSTTFTVLSEKAIEETDASGNFQYFIELRDDRIALREADIIALAVAKAVTDPALGADYKLYDSYLNLRLISKTRDSSGVINSATIGVDFNGGFVKQLTEEEVKTQSAGKNKDELTNFIPSHEDFKAKITLWPFWVMKVPKNQDRITAIIKVEKVEFDSFGSVIASSSSTPPTE